MFVTVFALGLAGPLTLRDGLYWLALADAAGGVLMLGSLARSIHLEPITVRFLAGNLPVKRGGQRPAHAGR